MLTATFKPDGNIRVGQWSPARQGRRFAGGMTQMETPRLVQIVPYNLASQVGEPTGFIALDDRGRIWRGILDPGGRTATMVLREVNVIFAEP